MNGKRTKQLRKIAIDMGIDISTIQLNGRGIPNLFRKMKKDYTNQKRKVKCQDKIS